MWPAATFLLVALLALTGLSVAPTLRFLRDRDARARGNSCGAHDVSLVRRCAFGRSVLPLVRAPPRRQRRVLGDQRASLGGAPRDGPLVHR